MSKICMSLEKYVKACRRFRELYLHAVVFFSDAPSTSPSPKSYFKSFRSQNFICSIFKYMMFNYYKLVYSLCIHRMDWKIILIGIYISVGINFELFQFKFHRSNFELTRTLVCLPKLTPHWNHAFKKIIEQEEPTINSSKLMFVHVKWPKWKSYDQGFFNWIKITDFFIVIYCFLESFPSYSEITPKNNKLLSKNL